MAFMLPDPCHVMVVMTCVVPCGMLAVRVEENFGPT